MASLTIVIKREDEHHFSGELKDGDTKIQTVYRMKKATTAIGNLVWSHKKLFKIRETQFSKEGLAILEKKGKHGVFVYINNKPEVKEEYAESFETALGQIVKKHQDIFGVKVDHIGH